MYKTMGNKFEIPSFKIHWYWSSYINKPIYWPFHVFLDIYNCTWQKTRGRKMEVCLQPPPPLPPQHGIVWFLRDGGRGNDMKFYQTYRPSDRPAYCPPNSCGYKDTQPKILCTAAYIRDSVKEMNENLQRNMDSNSSMKNFKSIYRYFYQLIINTHKY